MIRITRGATRGYRFKIFIDGVYRGKIKDNETVEFEVENGSHTVCAKADWRGSKTLSVRVKDSVVELEVGYAKQGWASKDPYNDFLHEIFSRNEYLFLREKSET